MTTISSPESGFKTVDDGGGPEPFSLLQFVRHLKANKIEGKRGSSQTSLQNRTSVKRNVGILQAGAYQV